MNVNDELNHHQVSNSSLHPSLTKEPLDILKPIIHQTWKYSQVHKDRLNGKNILQNKLKESKNKSNLEYITLSLNVFRRWATFQRSYNTDIQQLSNFCFLFFVCFFCLLNLLGCSCYRSCQKWRVKTQTYFPTMNPEHL